MNGHEAAALFRAMADRLERGAPEEFGGAFLLVPPGDNPAVDGTSWCSGPNPVAFWAGAQGQIEMAVEEFKARNSPQGAGRRY